MDPTLTMLQRVLAGASKRLVVSEAALREEPSIARVALETLAAESPTPIDWTTLRGFADWARRHPDALVAALEDPPPRTGTVLDAILASFTDELCATHGVERPRWTEDVPRLDRRWEPPGTPRMLKRARAATPRTFRRRNLTVAREDLFRAPAST